MKRNLQLSLYIILCCCSCQTSEKQSDEQANESEEFLSDQMNNMKKSQIKEFDKNIRDKNQIPFQNQQIIPDNSELLPPDESSEISDERINKNKVVRLDQNNTIEEILPDTIKKITPINDFSGSPPIPGSIRNMAKGEAPEEYIVESGDTLFDICQQLLGEGSFWPKLWSINPYIKNPHFIWPGMRLRFYPGDDEEPPYIAVVQEEEMIPLPEEPIQTEELLKEVILPEKDSLSHIPTEVITDNDIGPPEEEPDTIGKIFSSHKVQLTLPGFILPDQDNGGCLITGGATGENMVGEGHRFVCEASDHHLKLKTGSSYTALRWTHEVTDPSTEEIKAHLYQFVAHVKLTHKLDGNKLFLGQVTKSRLGLQKNDILVNYHSTRRFVSVSRTYHNPVNSDANIIAFETTGRQIGGQGDMVFLNKGASDGIAPGQLMKIDQSLQYRMSLISSDEIAGQTLPVGYLRIVDTTEAGAVGYIVYNSNEIFIGDTAGKG